MLSLAIHPFRPSSLHANKGAKSPDFSGHCTGLEPISFFPGPCALVLVWMVVQRAETRKIGGGERNPQREIRHGEGNVLIKIFWSFSGYTDWFSFHSLKTPCILTRDYFSPSLSRVPQTSAFWILGSLIIQIKPCKPVFSQTISTDSSVCTSGTFSSFRYHSRGRAYCLSP